MITILIWYLIGVIIAYISAAIINDYYIPKNKLNYYWEVDNSFHCLWGWFMVVINVLVILTCIVANKPTFKRKK